MIHTIEVETAVLKHLNQEGACTVEELFRSLPHLTVNQVFFAIDRLSREGRVRLRHPARFAYLISAVSSPNTVGSAHQTKGEGPLGETDEVYRSAPDT